MSVNPWSTPLRRLAIAASGLVALALGQQHQQALAQQTVDTASLREVRLRVTVLDYDGVPLQGVHVSPQLWSSDPGRSPRMVAGVTDAAGVVVLTGKTCLTCRGPVVVSPVGETPESRTPATRPDGTQVDVSTERGAPRLLFPVGAVGDQPGLYETALEVRLSRPQRFPITLQLTHDQPIEDSGEHRSVRLFVTNGTQLVGGGGLRRLGEAAAETTVAVIDDGSQLFCTTTEQVQRFETVFDFVDGGAQGSARSFEVLSLRSACPVSVTFVGDTLTMWRDVLDTIGDDDGIFDRGVTFVRLSDRRMWTWSHTSLQLLDGDGVTPGIQGLHLAAGEYLVMLGRFTASSLQLKVLNAIEAGHDLRATFPHVTVTEGGPAPEVVVDQVALLRAMKDLTVPRVE